MRGKKEVKKVSLDITEGVVFVKNEALHNLLVKTPRDEKKLTEFIIKEDCISDVQALWDLREYQLSNKLRGNVSIDSIVQAYDDNNHAQLQVLLQEKFLQPFTVSEYESFIRMFQRNNWTWGKFIAKFDSNTYRNVFQYVSCRSY